MLYEFHRQQNGKKPGTIHATYLISGTKREEPEAADELAEQDGEDTHMQSSPFMSSSMPQPEQSTEESGVLSITLVREENLEGIHNKYSKAEKLLKCCPEIQAQYEHISSIHIYSIGPHPLKVRLHSISRT
jgi:DNA polymerase delta subunit 3